MTLRRTALAGVAASLLLTCTSCNVAAFDADGDGTVTRQEFVTAIVDFFCGEEEPAPADGTNGGTPNEGGTPESDTIESGTTDQTTPQ